MGVFDHFPYTNFHELNLEWILAALKEIQQTMEDFVSLNAIKYADPIQWDITKQYEKNTIVIDPLTGTAYISVRPVPAGAAITDEDYWTVVFDLGQFVTKMAHNLANVVEPQTTLTATASSSYHDWIIWSDVLYRNINPNGITAGDMYVIGGNVEAFTVESVVGHIEDLTTADKTNLVSAINEVLVTLVNITGDLDDLNTADKTNLVSAINEVLQVLVDTCGDLNDLNTSDKTNLVNAINEVISTLNAEIESLSDELINISQFKRFGYFWEQYDTSDCYPQGFCIINNEYVVTYFHNTTTGDCVIKKSRLSDGSIIVTNSFNGVCHGNSLTYIPEADEVWAVNYYATLGAGVSNIITIFDADTLNIKTTITINDLSSISCVNYRDGKLFVATRDNAPQYYLYDLSGNRIQYLFTSKYPLMWLSYLKSDGKILATNGFNMAYEYSIDGDVLGAYQIPEISEDRSNYLAETEGVDELNGIVVISDVGYKRVNDRLYRRHILNTVGVFLVQSPNEDFHPLRLRSDSTFNCSNTYHTYQSGTTSNPIDSVEYASSLGGFIHTRPDIYGNNEVFNECVVMRDCGTVRIRNCTIGGLVVEDTELNAAGNFIINTACKDMVASYTSTTFGGCLYINRHSMVEFFANSNYVDCENDNTINYAIWKGPDCTFLGVGGTIKNMASNTLPIVSFWSESASFGGYFTDSNNDNPFDTLHRNQNQYDTKLRNRFGSVYGSQVLDLSSNPVALNNATNLQFKGKNFYGHMVTLTVNDNTYVIDITNSNRFDIVSFVSTRLTVMRFTITITNDNSGATLSINPVQECGLTIDIANNTFTWFNKTDSTAGSDYWLKYVELW